jgi:hypothetical protein
VLVLQVRQREEEARARGGAQAREAAAAAAEQLSPEVVAFCVCVCVCVCVCTFNTLLSCVFAHNPLGNCLLFGVGFCVDRLTVTFRCAAGQLRKSLHLALADCDSEGPNCQVSPCLPLLIVPHIIITAIARASCQTSHAAMPPCSARRAMPPCRHAAMPRGTNPWRAPTLSKTRRRNEQRLEGTLTQAPAAPAPAASSGLKVAGGQQLVGEPEGYGMYVACM